MVQQQAPQNIALSGTEEPDEKGRVLRAGSLSVEFHNGQLRYVRMGDEEVMRAVAFIVRDESWGGLGSQRPSARLPHCQGNNPRAAMVTSTMVRPSQTSQVAGQRVR